MADAKEVLKRAVEGSIAHCGAVFDASGAQIMTLPPNSVAVASAQAAQLKSMFTHREIPLSQGFTVAGNKYMALRASNQIIVGKCGLQGCVLARCGGDDTLLLLTDDKVDIGSVTAHVSAQLKL